MRITVIYICVLSQWDVFMGNCLSNLYSLIFFVMAVMRIFVILKHIIITWLQSVLIIVTLLLC